MDEFTEFERAAWEAKAERFAATWGSVTSQSIPFVLSKCRIGQGSRVLDIGCGTGDFAAAAVTHGASVVAIDASSKMCAITREKVREARVLESDAEHPPVEDIEFDAVTLNYLLLHVSDQALALKEAARAVKVGGVLAWTNWIAPAESHGMRLIFSALSEFADFSVIPPAQDIFLLSNPSVANEILGALGFRQVETMIIPTEWRVSSGSEFFEALQAGSRIGGLLELQVPEVRERLRTRIVSEAEKGSVSAASPDSKKEGQSIAIPMPSHLFTAVRDS